MKQRLVSLAIAGVMLLSVGGAVSATPTNENAIEKSCHGQRIANLATKGTDPGHGVVNPGDLNKSIKQQCAGFSPSK